MQPLRPAGNARLQPAGNLGAAKSFNPERHTLMTPQTNPLCPAAIVAAQLVPAMKNQSPRSRVLNPLWLLLLACLALLAASPGHAAVNQPVNFQSAGTVAHSFAPPSQNEEGDTNPGFFPRYF